MMCRIEESWFLIHVNAKLFRNAWWTQCAYLKMSERSEASDKRIAQSESAQNRKHDSLGPMNSHYWTSVCVCDGFQRLILVHGLKKYHGFEINHLCAFVFSKIKFWWQTWKIVMNWRICHPNTSRMINLYSMSYMIIQLKYILTLTFTSKYNS